MPRPGHRLDLAVMPLDPDAPLVEGLPSGGSDWVVGGCAGARLDVHPRAVLISRLSGGFVARCPRTDAIVTAAFVPAYIRHRDAGGARRIECPCGVPHDLVTLAYTDPVRATVAAAWARVVVHLIDAATAELTEPGRQALGLALGPFRVVARRPSG